MKNFSIKTLGVAVGLMSACLSANAVNCTYVYSSAAGAVNSCTTPQVTLSTKLPAEVILANATSMGDWGITTDFKITSPDRTKTYFSRSITGLQGVTLKVGANQEVRGIRGVPVIGHATFNRLGLNGQGGSATIRIRSVR